MSKEASVVALGIFVAVLPFLGFPQSWRVILFVIAGLIIALLGFMLRADHLHREGMSATSRTPRQRSHAAESAKTITDMAVPEPLAESSINE